MEADIEIILADDDPVMRELAGAKLREAGYRVREAVDGAEALKALREFGASLVVSDIDMPVMDGFALTRAIRKDPAISETPVMVITSSDSSEAVEEAFAAGATSFLVKPVNWPLFHHAVKFVLRAHDDRKALKQARDQAEAGSRFKDNLMSVMSHELRTPLNAIIGFGQIIAEQCEKQKDNLHREYADYIVDSGRRLLNSVSDMLLASDARSGPVVLNEVDVGLRSVVEEAMDCLEKPLAAAEAQAVLRVASDDVELTCDRTLVSRAICKLVENAIKFSPKGVKIFIGAAVTRTGDLAVIVKDNGPGINQGRVEEISAPFAQLDMSKRRSREGLGLGLPLVRAIADAHGGTFRLDSTVEEGTRAVFTLPSARVRATQGAEAIAEPRRTVA